MSDDRLPRSDSIQHVDAGGFYLTHAIWRNSHGSYQPETGVRSHAAGLKDFRLIQHNCDNWPMVTAVTLKALAKGWDTYRIGELIEWLDWREKRHRTRARFAAMHDKFVRTLRGADET